MNLLNYLYHSYYLKGRTAYLNYKKLAFSSSEDFQRRRLEKLNSLLNYSNENVEYYRNVFSQIELPKKNGKIILSHIEDIQLLPVLNKEIIRNEQDRMFSKEHKVRNATINTSGGSTGEPIKVLQDRYYERDSAGLFAFVKYMRTRNPYGKSVLLWGATRDLYGKENNIKGKLADLLNNTKTFNSAKLTPKAISDFISHINKTKPQLIIAYVQSIYEVASFIEDNQLEVTKGIPIHTGAGQLFPFMRKKIERAFSTQVFNHYGGREFGAVATECSEHNGLHILGDTQYVEIVNENFEWMNYGEQGEILVTNFTNLSMPLIRYKVGDLSVFSKQAACSCGVVYPKIENIKGRTSNNFKLPDGGFVSGEYLTLTFNHLEGVKNFQIVQKTIDKIEIYLITTGGYDRNRIEEIVLKKMKKLFNENLQCSFFYVEEIPKTKTGKHLFTLSKI